MKKKDYYKLARALIKKYADYERNKYEDRNVLESIIFPYVLTAFEPKTILDIGREEYQRFYNEFFTDRELWTLDIDPECKIHGAKKHICDCASSLKKYFKNSYFDFILMNGVFGWGLDDHDEVQTAFNAIFDLLKPGGFFVLGWNDLLVPLEKIEGLNKLKPYHFAPLKSDQFTCVNGNHTYNFYIKN